MCTCHASDEVQSRRVTGFPSASTPEHKHASPAPLHLPTQLSRIPNRTSAPRHAPAALHAGGEAALLPVKPMTHPCEPMDESREQHSNHQNRAAYSSIAPAASDPTGNHKSKLYKYAYQTTDCNKNAYAPAFVRWQACSVAYGYGPQRCVPSPPL